MYHLSMDLEKKQNQTRWSLSYHILWSTRRRKQVLIPLTNYLSAILHEEAQTLDVDIISLRIMPNYVHLFVDAPPTIAPSDIIVRLKNKSASILRNDYKELQKMPSLWTRAYIVSTSYFSDEGIKDFLNNQNKL